MTDEPFSPFVFSTVGKSPTAFKLENITVFNNLAIEVIKFCKKIWQFFLTKITINNSVHSYFTIIVTFRHDKASY